MLKSKVEGKVVQLKEEKSLLSQFLIASRKRPDLDLEYCLGNFEFSVVPKALFTTDGEPLACTDKSKILHHIEDLGKLQQQSQMETSETTGTSVLIIDGIAVLNQITKTSDMKTCKVCGFFQNK